MINTLNKYTLTNILLSKNYKLTNQERNTSFLLTK